MIRRTLLTLAALAPLAWAPLSPSAALAAETAPFTSDAFTSAQKAGRSILVHVTAPWCHICTVQKPVIDALEAEPRFHDLMVFTIDFDSQKAAARQVGARMQSTLITYKGETETARSIGETQPEWIESVVEKAL